MTQDDGSTTWPSRRPVGGTGVATVDDCRITYRRAGTEGHPIVLLHGGGIDDALLSWRHVIAALADDHQVYAPNWPGYADSVGSLEHSVSSYVTVLEGFLDSIGVETATLAGISMGGAAALGLALEQPDRIDRLVLVDSYGLGSRIPAGSLWKTFATIPGANAMGWAAMGLSSDAARLGLGSVVADASALDAEFVEAFRRRASRLGAGVAFEAFQRNEIAASGAARTDFSTQLEALSIPTLLVHGADDPLFPARWSRRAADVLPNATLAVLEACGHWPPRECPETFTRELRAFLTVNPPEE